MARPTKQYREAVARLKQPGPLDELNDYVRPRLPKMTASERTEVQDLIHGITQVKLAKEEG